MNRQRIRRNAQGSIALCLLFAATLLFAGKATVAQAGAGSVRVKITFIAMRRSDVRKLAVIAPPINKRSSDLQALENAARRAHVHFSTSSGPTITARSGRTTSHSGVDVTPLSVHNGRAYVRIRETQRTKRGRRSIAHVVVASHLYHSGETRRLAGQIVTPRDYRYVFATVTVLP